MHFIPTLDFKGKPGVYPCPVYKARSFMATSVCESVSQHQRVTTGFHLRGLWYQPVWAVKVATFTIQKGQRLCIKEMNLGWELLSEAD